MIKLLIMDEKSAMHKLNGYNIDSLPAFYHGRISLILIGNIFKIFKLKDYCKVSHIPYLLQDKSIPTDSTLCGQGMLTFENTIK